MAIVVDVSAAIHAKAGLARYAQNLVTELRSLMGDALEVFQNNLGQQAPLPGWEEWRTHGTSLGYKPWRLAVLLSQLVGARMNRLMPGCELFHATEHLLPYLGAVPTVLTVHDLIFERFPEHHKFLNYRYLKAAMPLFCRRATALIAVSEATKRDLVEIYGVSASKVIVIPEAAAPHFMPQSADRVAEVRTKYGLPERYLVSVGTIEPRKNLARLVDACGPLLADGTIEGLVLVGSKGWLYEGFFAHLEACPWRSQVIFPGFVADADLPAVYAGAQCTVQPSLYEGFGLPVLEAMASGSPVCCSRSSSLPEVAGDAARYFDPAETEDIRQVLQTVLADQALRDAMREQGLSRAAGFSWRHTAELTYAVYQSLLGSAD